MRTPAIDAEAFRSFEVAGWEKTGKAEAYHDFFGPITSRAIDPLLAAAHVASAMRVLDVATGPGYVAARASERGASAVGVDIAQPMVALARKLHPTIEFREADAERLPFADESFDAVLGNFVILHLAQPEQATAEFARVLRPGGRVALSVWDFPDRMRLLGIILDAVDAAGASAPPDIPAGPPFYRFSSDEEFTGLLVGAGLERIQIERLSFLHRLSGADELWEAMLGSTVRTAALLLGQTQEMRQRIRAALDHLLLEYAAGDGLELPVSIKLASGQKASAGRG